MCLKNTCLGPSKGRYEHNLVEQDRVETVSFHLLYENVKQLGVR
jgi:hypothetical protein